MTGSRQVLVVGLLVSAVLIAFMVSRGREPEALLHQPSTPRAEAIAGRVALTPTVSNTSRAQGTASTGKVLDAMPTLQAKTPRERIEHLRSLQSAIVKPALKPFEERTVAAATLLAALNAQAAAGDAGATVAANALIDRCGRLIPMVQHQERAPRDLAANATDCRQLSRTEIQMAMQRLIDAAAQGDVLANLQLLDRGGTETRELSPLLPLVLHDPALSIAQQNAIRAAIAFLEPTGSPGILGKASNAFAENALLPADKSLWFAYYAASYAMTSTNPYSPEGLQTSNRILNHFNEQINPDERERAVQTANAILAHCCAGVTFDLGMLKK